MPDDHDQINQAIRQRAAYARVQRQEEEAEPERAPAPDFGAGARRAIKP